MESFKIFVSSPGDVMVERRRVENVVSRLNGEFAKVARLEAIRWETESYQAYSTFQSQIPRSTECDLVVGILKWRLGTELPPDFDEKLPDGRPYPSGTAYEILTAISQRQKGAELPDIYVFRATSSPMVAIEDPNRTKIEHDWHTLKGFLQEWFLTEKGSFKAAFNSYNSEDDFEAQLEKLLRKWVSDKVTVGRVVRWPIEVNGSPFRGLAAFGTKHAPVFFGRSRDRSRAVELWREAGSRGSPYLLVVGASGSGKSSLARAGLIPRLTTPGVVPDVDVWRIAVMQPGDSPMGPFTALADALMQGVANLPKEEEGRGPALPELAQGDSATPAELASVLSHADPATAVKPIINALARVAAGERERESYRRDVRCDLILLVDQLDELFAAAVSDEDRAGFIKLVAALVATRRIWVVTTLRADFYARILDQPILKKLKEEGTAYDLTPPGPFELAEIIRGPVEAAGLVYEVDAKTGESLDARLLRDAERPDMLPLVQLALSRLFEARETDGAKIRLSLTAYEGSGGLKGIINEAGESALARLGRAEAERLPRLLRQLAVRTHDQDRSDRGALTIRGVPLAQAAPDEPTQKLVNSLVAARLLTMTDTQVRLTHQRVLEDWSRARTIVAQNAEFYRIREELTILERSWRIQKRDDLLIPPGFRLSEAESLWSDYGMELDPNLVAFISASLNAEERRARQKDALSSETFKFALKANPRLVIGLKTGDILKIEGIDTWVCSENTDMMMDRVTDQSTTASIRYGGAEKDRDGSIRVDTIALDLRRKLRGRVYVRLGTVLETVSGALRATNDVRRLIHVAALDGIGPGRGYRALEEGIYHYFDAVLQHVETRNSGFMWFSSPIRSLLVPLLGVDGGLTAAAVAPKLVDAAIKFFENSRRNTLEEIYLLAVWNADKDACMNALENRTELKRP
jgi:hypothetical protein